MKKWRIIKNGWNLKAQPWSGAVGIEEIDRDLIVPSIVCWFCRGCPSELPQHVVDLHNKAVSDAQKT